MPAIRKTQAKYGAKIPSAPSTRAKQTEPGKQDAPVDAQAKAPPDTKKVDAKSKR